MHTTPRVSIIIAYSGEEQQLFESVRSAQAQSYPNSEVIVVDDSAVGVRAETLLSSAASPRLQIHRNAQKSGSSAARNKAAQLSSAELLVPLDPGDLIAPEFLELTIAALSEGGFAGIYTNVQDFSDDPALNYMHQTGLTITNLFCGDLCPTTMLWSKNAFDSLGGYKTNLDTVATHDLMIRALKQGFTFSHVAQPLYMRRQYPEKQPQKAGEHLRELVRENRETAIAHLQAILVQQTERFSELADRHDAMYEQCAQLHSLVTGKYEQLKEMQATATKENSAQKKDLAGTLRSFFSQRP